VSDGYMCLYISHTCVRPYTTVYYGHVNVTDLKCMWPYTTMYFGHMNVTDLTCMWPYTTVYYGHVNVTDLTFMWPYTNMYNRYMFVKIGLLCKYFSQCMHILQVCGRLPQFTIDTCVVWPITYVYSRYVFSKSFYQQKCVCIDLTPVFVYYCVQ
jgi:hypothetical protein